MQISSDVGGPYKKAGGVSIEEISCTITLGQGGHNPVLPVKRLRSENQEHSGSKRPSDAQVRVTLAIRLADEIKKGSRKQLPFCFVFRHAKFDLDRFAACFPSADSYGLLDGGNE